VTVTVTEAVRLQAGDEAPGFVLPDADGRTVELAAYRGSNVVLYAYPAASTPGCTTQACDFRDSLAGLRGAGYEVLGLSPDKPGALARFVGVIRSTFVLDEQGRVAQASYGVKVKGHVAKLRRELHLDDDRN